jgi:hypothetical protein
MGPDMSASDGVSRTNTAGRIELYPSSSIESRARELIAQCARVTEALNRISARIDGGSEEQASGERSGLIFSNGQPQASRPAGRA